MAVYLGSDKVNLFGGQPTGGSTPVLQSKTKSYTPTESAQSETVTYDSGYDGLSSVEISVGAISSSYVGSGITRRDSTDLTASGRTVSVPAGYYESAVSKAIAAGSATVPANIIGSGASIGYSKANQRIELMKSVSVTPVVTAGYVSSGTEGTSNVDLTAACSINDSDSLTASGATVTAPAGYYPSSASKSVATGSVSASATKGSVSNHSVQVTPTATVGTAGYLAAGSTNGTAVSVAASELVSGTKSITSNGTGIDVTNYAAVDVSVGGGTPSLQSKTKSYTPSESAQSETVTYDSGYDGLSSVEISVGAISSTYVGTGITRRSSIDLAESGGTVTAPAGYYSSSASKSVPSMTLPIATSSSSSGTQKLAIDASTSGTRYINIPTGYNSSAAYYQINAVATGTAGTPTASKGTVNNHSVSVTPSVTNTTGYITGGTKTGTAVTVQASELVSGSQTITTNNTYDVTNLASVVVNVSGGGSSSMQIDTKTSTPSSAGSSISFTGLSGEPTSFYITSNSDLATGASPFKVAAVVFDGTNLHGQTITNTSNAQVSYNGSSFSKSYSSGTLTVTSSSPYFQANQYTLVYTYGGTSANIGTADVQVGSGATSITFTGLDSEPDCFSAIFKSNFSTSSGYQRVICVVYDGTSTYGLEMDSGAKYSSVHWSHSYSSGSLTITSQGTNAGGYFHQPGYYQLTFAVGGDQSLQTKTVTPTTSTQNVTADTGYTALKKVVVNPIPSQYIVPTGNKEITSNGTGIDVAAYSTVSVAVPTGGSSNFVTGTFTTGSTTSTTGSVTISYSGSGYPLMVVVEVEGGMYNSAISPWYSSVTRYAVGQFIITKGVHTSSPTYGTSGTQNYGCVQVMYKNSTSSSTSYTSTRSATANSYSSSNANGTNTTCVRMKSNTSLSYYICGGSSSTYGLLASTTYRYYIVYSS